MDTPGSGAQRSAARRARRFLLELESLERLRVGADLLDLALGRRDQALLGEIAVFTQRLLAGVLGYEFVDAGDHADVRLLHVDEERTRSGILARGDGLEGRRNTVDHRTLELVEVFLEEAVAEDADGSRVGGELLHDQVVVLARLDVRPVFTHRGALALEVGFIVGAQLIEPREAA